MDKVKPGRLRPLNVDSEVWENTNDLFSLVNSLLLSDESKYQVLHTNSSDSVVTIQDKTTHRLFKLLVEYEKDCFDDFSTMYTFENLFVISAHSADASETVKPMFVDNEGSPEILGHIGFPENIVFNEDNYGSNQDIIRDIISWYAESYTGYTSPLLGSIFHNSRYFVHPYCDESTKKIFIIMNSLDSDEVFTFKWTKGSPKTDMIERNGNPINLKEYMGLVNQLCQDPFTRKMFGLLLSEKGCNSYSKY
jgi:hypothetical protein